MLQDVGQKLAPPGHVPPAVRRDDVRLVLLEELQRVLQRVRQLVMLLHELERLAPVTDCSGLPYGSDWRHMPQKWLWPKGNVLEFFCV